MKHTNNRTARAMFRTEPLTPPDIRPILERCSDDPSQGPRILFFSGGTALRDLSKRIIRHSSNTIHLITPFDSGGSSASLRRAFSMPAPGDLRNRLMALADGGLEINELFAHRFPKGADKSGLDEELAEMASGAHPLSAKVPEPLGGVVRHYLDVFLERMPRGFDLSGASVGNLILTAGYLEADRSFAPAIFSFSHLAGVRGTVLPTVEDDLHLAAEMEDGTTIYGQHLLTGKETAPLSSRILRLSLARDLQGAPAPPCAIGNTVRKLIAGADLIVFPMGSFFTSVLANLLPEGVGTAVASNPCPKVFIPNLGHDPECQGLSAADQALMLRNALLADIPPDPDAIPLDFVLADLRRGDYGGTVDQDSLAERGIITVDADLVTPGSTPLLDADRVIGALFSFAAMGTGPERP